MAPKTDSVDPTASSDFPSAETQSHIRMNILDDVPLEVDWRRHQEDDDSEKQEPFFDERKLLDFTGFDIPKTSLGFLPDDDDHEGRRKEKYDEDDELHEMQLQLDQMEQDRDNQAQRANELEQILNGYESNNPKEALLTKELELADATMKIEALTKQVKDLEEAAEKQKRQQEKSVDADNNNTPNRRLGLRQRSFRLSDMRRSSDPNQQQNLHEQSTSNNGILQKSRSFRWSPRNTSNENNSNNNSSNKEIQQQQLVNNRMMQKSKSFRWSARNTTTDKEDDDNNDMLKTLLVQLRTMGDQKAAFEEKCKSQENTIASLRSRLANARRDAGSKDENDKHSRNMTLNHSLHKRIMQTQVQALEEERNEFSNKCKSQEKTISKLESQMWQMKEEKAELEKKHQEQQQKQKSRFRRRRQEQPPPKAEDPLMVSLHRKTLQTQVEALEEERTCLRNKCLTRDSKIGSLQEENNLLRLKIEMLEQMVECGNQ